MVISIYGKSRKDMYTIQNVRDVMKRNPKLIKMINSGKCHAQIAENGDEQN